MDQEKAVFHNRVQMADQEKAVFHNQVQMVGPEIVVFHTDQVLHMATRYDHKDLGHHHDHLVHTRFHILVGDLFVRDPSSPQQPYLLQHQQPTLPYACRLGHCHSFQVRLYHRTVHLYHIRGEDNCPAPVHVVPGN